VRALLLLTLLSGCNKLFQLEHVDESSPLIDAPHGDGAPDSRRIDAPPDTIAQTHSNCPANFGVGYENSKYRYLATPMSWYDAMRFCANLDDPTSTKRVHLPVLSSDFERNHIYVMVVGSASGYWIGLSDTKTIGAYQWVTAEQVNYPVASSWGTGEPSENPGDACVRVILSSNDLDSTLCMTQMPFVCECDDYALAPSQYTLM